MGPAKSSHAAVAAAWSNPSAPERTRCVGDDPNDNVTAASKWAASSPPERSGKHQDDKSSPGDVLGDPKDDLITGLTDLVEALDDPVRTTYVGKAKSGGIIFPHLFRIPLGRDERALLTESLLPYSVLPSWIVLIMTQPATLPTELTKTQGPHGSGNLEARETVLADPFPESSWIISPVRNGGSKNSWDARRPIARASR